MEHWDCLSGSANSYTQIKMKVAKIQDLEALADGTVIGEMVVQIKAAFDAKTGKGKYGDWRVQPVILKDATGEVRASFWISSEMRDLVGQTITIKSQAGNKGLAGISVKNSTHSGKNELSVTEKAAIIDGTQNAFEQYTKAVAINTSSAKSPHQLAAANPSTARKRLFQQAQLYSECIKAATYIRDNNKMTDEHFQAAVASMYISADRGGLFACFPDGAKVEKPTPVDDEISMDFEAADAAAKPKKKDELEEELGW